MSRILVVDDDPDIRALIATYLRPEGHAVEFAEDGARGLETATSLVPDLVLADFQMPRMDGFALFSALRANPKTARVPVVMLTAHHSRALMLKALAKGLDDFVGKPVTREDLVKVVARLVKPARGRRATTTRSLAAARAEFLGSVACCEICRLEAFMLKLRKPELVELLDQFAAEVVQAVEDDGGWLIKPDAHHLVVGFPEEAANREHAVSALRCALKIVVAAQRLKPWIARRFPGKDLPEFLVAVGVHTGTIQVRPPRAGVSEASLAGEAVQIAGVLAESILALGWSVAASQATAQAARFAFLAGRQAKVLPPDGGELGAIEVKGFKPAAPAPAVTFPDKTASLVEAAVDRNATLVTYAAAIPKPAPPSKAAAAKAAAPKPAPRVLPAMPAPKPAPLMPAPKAAPQKPAPRPASPKSAAPSPAPAPKPVPPPKPSADPFAGRRIALKLSDNGVVAVTLVNPEDGGAPQVVKTILINDDKKGSKRARLGAFVDQYAAMRAVEHANIARIAGCGLSATHLFVVQEYCPGGDLQNLIAQKMSPEDALKALLRVAGALKAAHQAGFIHGDLRPPNVMLREDGSIAVVDFALASAVEYAIGEGDAGVMLRSPEYLSPETINGSPADVRSDIYTLGLLFHEMLTGQRAYASPDLSKVMADQLSAAVPGLPAPYEKFQPLLNQLMAKTLAERFASVADVIAFMAEAKLQG
jgi:CheY-like chemotaxis protein